jgi:hypothetical protein
MPRTEAQEQGIIFEREVANTLGQNLHPGSGNKFYVKNDSSGNGFSTSSKSQQKFTWNEIKKYLDEAIDDSVGTGNIAMLALEDNTDKEQYIFMRLNDLAKAFANGIKIDSKVESKGLNKRESAEVPLMLR